MNKQVNNFQVILNGLVHRYQERVPDVSLVLNAMRKEGIIAISGEIENDHIAFRTLGVPHLGVGSLEKIFLHYGYSGEDEYFFPEKKLNARWYAPPAEGLPRIFISELRVADLSFRAEDTIHAYTGRIKKDPVDSLDLDDAIAVDQFLHSSLWRVPTLEDYELLAWESEYAAWAIYNRYYLNHFTIALHNLKDGYQEIGCFNAFLERQGVLLNDAGGKIKVSGDGLLLQSSTVAQMVKGEFAYGKEKMIPGSYLEFAERKPLPAFAALAKGGIKNIHRRDGFEAANADKIFESTYASQVNRS